jgi:hypothetical protein
MLKKFLSRKLVALILTGVVVPILQAHGVPQDTINWFIGLVTAYIAGQSVVDTVTVAKGA